MSEMTIEDILALADAIGESIEKGNLPPLDENGFYDFSRAPRIEVS